MLDYKFYCFNGAPKFLYVGYANFVDGIKNDLLTFFDLNWNSTPFYRTDHEQIPFPLVKPKVFDKMTEITKKLSENTPFLRVDLYYINGHVYFSELTFYPGSGLGPFEPLEWENKIGEWIDLSGKGL